MRKYNQGLIAIHLATILFGFPGLFGKLLPYPPVMIVFGRTLFAALALLLYFLFRKQKQNIDIKKLFFLFPILGLILAVHWILFFHAIKISTVAIGLLTFSTFPVFVTLLEPLLFRERLRLFDIGTSLLVLAGLAIVLPKWDFHHQLTQGAFFGTLSGLTFAVLLLLNRKYVQVHAPLVIALFQNGFAALFVFPWAVQQLSGLTVNGILLLIILGIFCTALPQVLAIMSLKNLKAQLASLVICLEPIYGVVYAIVFLAEYPEYKTLLGGSIVIGTSGVAMLRKRWIRETASVS